MNKFIFLIPISHLFGGTGIHQVEEKSFTYVAG